MKRKFMIIILAICILLLTGCNEKKNKDENIFSENKASFEDEYHSKEESTKNQNIDYQSYNDIWSEDGAGHDEILSNGGTEFQIKIINNNEIVGFLFSQQGMSERTAEIDDITGKIENGECYYKFQDDGWGNSGTLHIMFQQDKIDIEVQDFVLNENNSSGFGICGSYQLIRQKDSLKAKKTETDLEDDEILEEEIQDKIYERYYSAWTDDEMLKEIEKRKPYRDNCSFYSEVFQYMENIREVRDISAVVEPLYYTDMKYYTEDDFVDVPPVIIYLAKNEVYARHGYIFKDSDLNNYFMGQIWYSPQLKADQFSDEVFNEYEVENLKLLAGLDLYKK